MATAWLVDPAWPRVAVNVAALLLFAPAVEDRLGRLRFAGLIALAAASTTLGPALTGGAMFPVTGAAAPIAAVLATYASLFPTSRLVFWLPGPRGGVLHELPAAWAMALWAVVVPGDFARFLSAGPVGPSALVQTLTGAAIGVVAAHVLPIRGRLRVDWWDGREK
jgi:membrane associated rhomboid family serine protease